MRTQFSNISEKISHNNFCHPNVNRMDSSNTNFKKQRESITNQISNKAKIVNHYRDIKGLINLRKLYANNSIIGYLNSNSLTNKITQLREVFKKAAIDLLCIDDTILDVSFLNAQFHIEGYQSSPIRRGHDKNGGGKMIFIREGLIGKGLYTYEDSTFESICLEVTLSKKKWCVTFADRPPHNSNKTAFSKS